MVSTTDYTNLYTSAQIEEMTGAELAELLTQLAEDGVFPTSYAAWAGGAPAMQHTDDNGQTVMSVPLTMATSRSTTGVGPIPVLFQLVPIDVDMYDLPSPKPDFDDAMDIVLHMPALAEGAPYSPPIVDMQPIGAATTEAVAAYNAKLATCATLATAVLAGTYNGRLFSVLTVRSADVAELAIPEV